MVNHDNLAMTDYLRLVGELEHSRFHALAAAASMKEGEEPLPYLVIAKHAQTARRELMRKHFKDVNEKDWCLVKCAGTLLQLMSELGEGDAEEIKSIKAIVDEIILEATGEDISGCQSCRGDADAV